MILVAIELNTVVRIFKLHRANDTEEIVLLGGADRTTTEINKLLGQLPPAVQALTGVDLTGALTKIPGATAKA